MTRSEAIKLFGSRQSDLGDALGISRSAIAQWPEQLTQRQADMVIGAAVRLGRLLCEENSDRTVSDRRETDRRSAAA